MKVGALRSADPDRLGPYALIGRIGEGGQGTVYLGTDEDGRQVAIKLLHADLTSDDKARARFLRELEVAKQVAPFCTAQVLDADATGDRPYIVSEYVRGPSLNQHVLAEGPLRGPALDRLAVGTATALSAIHQAGIVHRDFKPHNVLLGPDGPRVIDFGVARAIGGGTTLTSRVIGTPSYMSPEQIAGDEVGTASDVFCWAGTLVFAATGEPPFGQDTIPAVINRILHEEPDLGGLRGPLRDLVLDCLDKDPARRPTAREVLMRLLGHEEGPRTAADAPAARAADATDETAMLAAGSVRAAELDDADLGDLDDAAFDAGPSLGDDDRFAKDAPGRGEPGHGDPGRGDAVHDDADYDDDAVFRDPEAQETGAVAFPDVGVDAPDRDPAATAASGRRAGRPSTPAGWAAADTLPPDAPGDGGGRGPRRRIRGSGRRAVLAGAAALFVAIVVVSSVLALGSGGDGKAGQKVSDPSAPPASSELVPNTTLPPPASAPVEEEPQEPTTSPPPDSTSPTEVPSSPTGDPDPTGEPTGPTSPPTSQPTPPDDEPTEPEDPPTDEPPGDGGGDPGGGGQSGGGGGGRQGSG